MNAATNLRRILPSPFASTAHQIAGQVAALRAARNRLVVGMTVAECRAAIDEMAADLEARLGVNASVGAAVLPEYLGEFNRAGGVA